MRILLFIFISIIPTAIYSQVVKGVVYGRSENGNEPLPGVNIYWEGTTAGTASKEDGSFDMRRSNNRNNLVFSFIGYKTKTVKVAGNQPLEVVLDPNSELAEVTIIQKDRGSYLSTINPIQTENITGAELCKAACCNLAESFETNPSVDASYSDAVTGAKQIRLLGLEGTYSQLQVENLPDLRGLATNFGLTYIPGPWMESIQVSKGAASVQNGYESIAGQINVEFKKPDALEKFFFNLFTSAEGKMEINSNAAFKLIGDTLTTGIFIHAENLSRELDHNHDNFLDHPLSKQINLLNRWKYNSHKGFMVQAGASVLLEDRLGGEIGFDKGMELSASNPYGINIQTDRLEAFLKIGYVFPSQRLAIAYLTNAALHKTRSFYGLHRYDADETRMFGNLVLTTDLDQLGYHSLNAGGGFIYDKFSEELYNLPIEREEVVPGMFAEYTYKPGDNLVFMAGIRADFHNLFGTFVTPRMHFKYNFLNYYTLRLSAGKGYRTANVLSENNYLLASSRPLLWSSDVMQEEAWNYGITFVQNYQVWERNMQINAEFFRTDFQKQLVADRETSADNIILSPLDGESYANSLQFDVRYEVVPRFDLLLAYRVNDVKQTIGGELLKKPLQSKYKGLINMNYSTRLKKWVFDYTIQFNGGGRIPRYPIPEMDLMNMAGDYYEFSPYTVMNAQVTKYFRNWNIYFGAENLADFKQMHPVEGAGNPFGSGFDATNVWGPILGRKVYLGIRLLLNYE